MFENHRKQNDEWIERMRQEIDAERRATAEEKMTGKEPTRSYKSNRNHFSRRAKNWMPL